MATIKAIEARSVWVFKGERVFVRCCFADALVRSIKFSPARSLSTCALWLKSSLRTAWMPVPRRLVRFEHGLSRCMMTDAKDRDPV